MSQLLLPVPPGWCCRHRCGASSGAPYPAPGCIQSWGWAQLQPLGVGKGFSSHPGPSCGVHSPGTVVRCPDPPQDAEEQPHQLHPQRQLHGAAQRAPALAVRQPDQHHRARRLRHAAVPLHAVRRGPRGAAPTPGVLTDRLVGGGGGWGSQPLGSPCHTGGAGGAADLGGCPGSQAVPPGSVPCAGTCSPTPSTATASWPGWGTGCARGRS